jgi:predicted nucleic acid-binding protein
LSHCVLDSSIALAWVLPGEGSTAIADLLDVIVQSGASVPEIWPLEVANVLLVSQRRGRIDVAEQARALSALAALPIEVETSSTDRIWSNVLPLAETHKLSAYDASYLALAIRLNLPLATLDRDLSRAATEHGMTLIA